jgi:CHAT domain-containing protein
MWTSRAWAAVALLFLSAAFIWPALGQLPPGIAMANQWVYPKPIQSVIDFEQATEEAWARNLHGDRLDAAQQIMAEAVQWAKVNPSQVDRSRLALAVQEDADIAVAASALDHAQASFREALAILDRITQPDPGRLYHVLKRLSEVCWYLGQPDIAVARRLSLVQPAVLEGDLMLTLGIPAALYRPGDAGWSPPFQEPVDAAFSSVRSELDTLTAILLDAPDAQTTLADAIITRQAVVQDVEAGIHEALFTTETRAPEVPNALASFAFNPVDPPKGPRTRLDALRTDAAAMSLLAYANPRVVPRWLPKPRELQQERADTERRIAQTIQKDWTAASTDQILGAIPDDAVVLDYAIYKRPATAAAPVGEARYLVAALTSHGVQKVADIGSFAEINALISSACRAVLRSSEESAHCFEGKPSEPNGTAPLKTIGQELFRILLGPVAQSVAGASHIIIVPDGELQFFPFEALTDGTGAYLIRSHLVSYIQSPREIPLWKTAPAPSRQPPVIIADPDYDAGGPAKPDPCSAPDDTTPPHRALRTDGNLDDFARLCGTQAEARSVAQTLPDATLLTGAAATEEAVKGLFSPRILHIATHGFVVQELHWPDAWFHPEEHSPWWGPLDFRVMNGDALLRGGLVFAGANVHASPGRLDDGILSAREASLLNLAGTQLVVLSACDSGLGLARAGDGVVGLRRAFVLAGARAQTFSLWPVGDATTATFMGRYYSLLAEGMPNAEALAQVKRRALDEGGLLAEPWAWAAFVAYGYPGALSK